MTGRGLCWFWPPGILGCSACIWCWNERLAKGEDLVSVSQAFQRVFGSRGRPSPDTTPSSCARGENEDHGLALLERGACKPTHAHTHTHILWPRTDDQQDLAYTLHTEVTCDKNNHRRALRTRAFICTAELVVSRFNLFYEQCKTTLTIIYWVSLYYHSLSPRAAQSQGILSKWKNMGFL